MEQSLKQFAEQFRADKDAPETKFEMTDAEREYWREVKEIKPEINYAPRDLYYYAFNRGSRILKNTGRRFVIDDENIQIYKDLALYFANDERSGFNLKKGICFFGKTGVGKTLPFRCFAELRSKNAFNSSDIISVRKLLSNYEQGGSATLFEYDGRVVVLDELSSKHTARHYGTEINVVEEFLEHRYNQYISNGIVTHITSNILQIEMIGEIFGPRVLSRFYEMFTVVKVPGKDRRI